jgi:putative phosphoribosyl transferase
MSQSIITNRNEAGKLLAEKLLKYKNKESTIILAIPRGGVPVGFSIAKALHLSLDIVLSKKIAHPYNPEFAIGSVCNDTVIMDPTSEVPMAYVESEISRIKKDLKDRYHHFSGEGKFTDVKDKIVILVDDGIATGNTVLATIKMLREKKPTSIIVAVPVLPMDNLGKIKNTADDLVYLFAPIYFPSVGSFYKEFTQIEDSEVKKLLAQNKIQQQSPIEEEDIYFNEDFLL